MADESFILSLVGQLNQKQTEDNIRDILSTINKNLKNTNMNNIKVFNKEDLLAQGKIFIESIEDIQNEIRKQLKLTNEDKISIATIFDDKGAIEKFKVSVTDALKVLKEFNFEAAKFSDGSAGFVMNSSGTQQTTQQMQQMEEQANKSKAAMDNIPKGFNEANWGNVTQSFADIKDFLRVYQQTIGNFSGNPNMNFNLDKDGNIRGFTADVKDANGALETMRFRLQNLGDKDNPDWQYVYQGSNVKDNVFEQQAKSLTTLEDKLATFKKRVNDGVTFKFIDKEDLNNQIATLENTLTTLKGSVGNNTTTDMESAEKTLEKMISSTNELERTEKKRQSEIDKTTKAIDRQNKQLNNTKAILDNYEKNKINPDSASFVGNSEKLDEVKIKLSEVIKLRNDLAEKSVKGEIIKQSELDNLAVKMNELRLLMSEARKASGQSIDRDESYKRISRDIKVLNSELDKNIARWKNMGVYANQFKKDVEDLQTTLNKKGDDGKYVINSTDRVRELKQEMTILNNKALEMKATNRTVSGSTEDISQKVELYKAKLETLEQRYADIIKYSSSFASAFNSVKNSLNDVQDKGQLNSWEQSFKLMQEGAKQTSLAMNNAFRSDQLTQKLALLKQQVDAFMTANPRAANVYKESFEQLKNAIDSCADSNGLKKLQNDFRSLKIATQQAGLAGKTFGQRMQDAFRRMSRYLGITSMMMYTVRAIREIINNVKELDTAMVRLKRVTDETDTTYKNMFDNAVKSAKELNASVIDILNSTATLSKLNFSPEVAAELANLITVYNNLAEIGNIDTATNDIVSIINGFNDLTADDAERIVDVLDNLGNRFAVSAADLGQILTRSSASLSEANNSLEEAVALGTVGNSIAMDASKVGNALKTVSLRIQSAKAKIDDAGLDGEDMVESTAELRRLIIAATGVDILEADQKTFRSTYQILLDISKVWQDIDDITRSSVLQKIAGKQQSNIVSAILNNGELLEQVYAEAMDSAGTAMKEQEVWADSIEAKFNYISGVFESISSNMLSSDTFKDILEIFSKLLNFVDELIKKGNGLLVLGTALGGIFGTMRLGVVDLQGTFNNHKMIKSYNEVIGQGAVKMNEYITSVNNANPALGKYLMSLNGARASTRKFTAETIANTVATATQNVVLGIFNGLINAGIALIVSKGISAFINWTKKTEKMTQALKEANDTLSSNTETLDDYRKKIDEIVNSEESESEKLKELGEVKDSLADKYDIEIEKLNETTQAREALIDAIERQSQAERKKYLEQNEEAYNKAKEIVDAGYTKSLIGDIWQAFTKGNQAFVENGVGKFTMSDMINANYNISDEIQKIFDTASLGSYNGSATASFTLGVEGSNEIEYYKVLGNALNEFYDIREKRGGELTREEEELYQMLLSQYNYLEDKNSDYFNNIEAYSTQKAYDIMDMTERLADESDEAYLERLILGANGDQYVVSALKRVIDETDYLNTTFKKLHGTSNDALKEILSNFEKIQDDCSELSTAIEEADEKFEKLAGYIDENKDVDKFFSASDIIEIVELYPELNDAILECAYGYKIEEEALETLRQAKVDEKKTALKAQLDEANSLLKSTHEKLGLYGDEVAGIKTVADAKIKLAELDNKLSGLYTNPNSFAEPDSYNFNQNAIEYFKTKKQMSDIQEYKDLLETEEELTNKVNALNIEYEVLGNTFDDAKDDSDDLKDSLNAQKDSINELKDAYGDAKDYINDLIDLTVQYLKKQKDLEKESIQNQIDEFKELCDRKKELLKLEQDQLKYEKELKDKNKSLLQTQLELEALSVEGVQYSLEDQLRKANLEQELSEKQDERNEYLYDHEIELREKAIDDEEESYTKSLEVQIKSIEDYLNKEGQIRSDAIKLIDGKSQEFYDNLMQYTLTYTDKSAYEFQQLWDKAYEAIMTYANGELNVELALMNVIGGLELAELELKNIESALNDIQNATTDAKQAMYEFQKVTADTAAETANALNGYMNLKQQILSGTTGKNASDLINQMRLSQEILSGNTGKNASDMIKYLRGYHTGGIVEGVSTEHGEVLAKLLSGEVVVTEGQARNFMENTLPKLTGNSTVTNNSMSPVINIGDIVVNGNADTSVISQLNNVRQQIVDDVFKVVNNQKNIYSGGRLRTV